MNSPAPRLPTRQEEQEFLQRLAIEEEARRRAGTWTDVIRAHVEYQQDPLGWIVNKLGVPEATLRWSMNAGYEAHTWDGDADPMVKILEALRDWRDCGVESGTGTGKSFLAACIVLWFLACFEDAIVPTVAPKEDQLLKFIWKEIGKLWPRFQVHFPYAIMQTGVIRMRPAVEDKERWAAYAFVCGIGADEDVATRAQGIHGEHVLIVSEETPGIPTPIMRALRNTRTDDHNLHLALGNPDHQQDELHLFCYTDTGAPRPRVVHVRISALDHPNVVSGPNPETGRSIVPGAIGRNMLAERIEEYGVGSRLYQSRICGICPTESSETLIKWEWLVAAGQRYNDLSYRESAGGALALGVDVANSERGDKAAISRWQGACCTEVEAFQCPDADQLGINVVNEARNPDALVDPRHVGVDDVGVGASTANAMKRLKFKARFISGGNRAAPAIDRDALWSQAEMDHGKVKARGPVVVESQKYDNLRSQVWYRTREDFRLGRIAIDPTDKELWQDLSAPRWGTANGKIWIETKEDVIARLKRSPNKGDAFVYGNFVRARELDPRQPGRADEVRRQLMNRDYGLEDLFERHERQEKAQGREFRRLLRQGRFRRSG